MIAFAFLVVLLAATGSLAAGTTRSYFIAAEDEPAWDYAPSGLDLLTGRKLAMSMVAEDFNTGLVGAERMHVPAMWYGMENKVTNFTEFDARLDEMNQNHGMRVTNGRLATTMDLMMSMKNVPRKGRVYKKAILVEYTDATFTVKVNRSEEDVHLGLVGPTLRAVVGDTLKVHFKNNVRDPQYGVGLAFSLHPHGVFYKRDDEGTPYNHSAVPNGSMNTSPGMRRDAHAALKEKALARLNRKRAGQHLVTNFPGDHLLAGQDYVYTWEVPERAGPGPKDGNSIAWFYHSHVSEPADTNAGLIGAIIVTRAGSVRDPSSARPVADDVDREIVALFNTFDENQSPFALDNFLPLITDNNFTQTIVRYRYLSLNAMFQESNRMFAVNGFGYGNAPGFTMRIGERVRWYVGALGNQMDIHGAHWHANTLTHHGNRVDSIPLIPAVFTAADMIPDNEGVWQFHCHTNHHIHAGMTALYEVLPAAPVVTTGQGSGVAVQSTGAASTTAGAAVDDKAAASSQSTGTAAMIGIVGLILFVIGICLLVVFMGKKKSDAASAKEAAPSPSLSDSA